MPTWCRRASSTRPRSCARLCKAPLRSPAFSSPPRRWSPNCRGRRKCRQCRPAAAEWISKEIHSPGRLIETCRSRQQPTSIRRRNGFLGNPFKKCEGPAQSRAFLRAVIARSLRRSNPDRWRRLDAMTGIDVGTADFDPTAERISKEIHSRNAKARAQSRAFVFQMPDY